MSPIIIVAIGLFALAAASCCLSFGLVDSIVRPGLADPDVAADLEDARFGVQPAYDPSAPAAREAGPPVLRGLPPLPGARPPADPAHPEGSDADRVRAATLRAGEDDAEREKKRPRVNEDDLFGVQ